MSSFTWPYLQGSQWNGLQNSLIFQRHKIKIRFPVIHKLHCSNKRSPKQYEIVSKYTEIPCGPKLKFPIFFHLFITFPDFPNFIKFPDFSRPELLFNFSVCRNPDLSFTLCGNIYLNFYLIFPFVGTLIYHLLCVAIFTLTCLYTLLTRLYN